MAERMLNKKLKTEASEVGKALNLAHNRAEKAQDLLNKQTPLMLRLVAENKRLREVMEVCTVIIWERSIEDGKDFRDGVLFALDAVKQNLADALYKKHPPEIMETFKDTIEELRKK